MKLHKSVMKMFAGGMMDRTMDNIAELWCSRIITMSSTKRVTEINKVFSYKMTETV